jgi:hypothetical protein
MLEKSKTNLLESVISFKQNLYKIIIKEQYCMIENVNILQILQSCQR